jgi:hypothetical protein
MRRWLILSLAAALCSAAAAPSADKKAPKGFDPLFNGKDLTGWKVFGGETSDWGVDDGILYTAGKGGGWLLTEKEYGDFELRLEYKVPKGGNSGVALRAPREGNVSYTGMEIQILDDPWYKDPANFKGIRDVQLTGAVYGVVPPSKEAVKPAGEWNKMAITANGRHITVKVNGIKIVDADLDDYKDHAKEHPGILRKDGHLGLQSHTDRVEFRNVYVKPLN